MKVLVTFAVFICITNYVKCDSDWEPISHPNGGYSIQQSFISHRDDRKLPSSRNDVDSAIISPIAQDIDTLQEFNKQNFVDDGSCAVNKYALDHEAVVNYDTKMEKLEQFTLCLWARFVKHDGDHVMFTYSVHDEAREIQFWVANVNSSSFLSMAVRGHSLYRLNYPLAMKKWHHMCTSWNGKTGEWQLWISKERVGRGFYNRLVSHEIEAHGQAFSGGKSPNGPVAASLHFEVTLVQLYKVALSAGKAHRNHKHHHVHKFDSNGEIHPTTTTPAPATATQPINPLLANGQFPTRVKINFAGNNQQPPVVGGLPQPPQPPQTINTNFNVGQFHVGSRHLQQQLIGGGGNVFGSRLPSQPISFPSSPVDSSSSSIPKSSSSLNFIQSSEFSPSNYQSISSSHSGFGSNPANVQFIDDSYPKSYRVRRSNLDSLKKTKRDLVTLPNGSIVDDKSFDSDWYDGLASFGDDFLKQSLSTSKHSNLEEEIKEHDKEPAELEVEASQSYCNFCLIEPFQSALVLSWKEATKTHGVLEAKASTMCGEF